MKRGELEPLLPHDCPDRPRCQLCAARRVIEESPRFMETMRKMCQVAEERGQLARLWAGTIHSIGGPGWWIPEAKDE